MSYPGSHPYDSSTDPKNSNPNHSMFASQQQHTQHSLYRTTSRDPPQSWPPYDQTSLSPFDSQPFPHRSFPTPTPYTGTPCSPPPNNTPVPSASRLSIAGSFDPTTGIFCRMPEHPRLRTAQACEKCRMRKAKCSGEHPSCKRCLNRGLVCEYAKEGRVRGPNRAKSTSVSSSKNTSVSATVDPDQPSAMKNTASSVEQPRPSSHTRDGAKTRDAYVPSEEKFASVVPLETPRVPSPPRIDALAMSQNASSSRVNALSQRLHPSSVSTSLGQSSGLNHRRHSHPRPLNLGINHTNPWRQEPVVHMGSSQTKWVDRPGVGLDVVGNELGISAQGSQPQFGRQHFAKQQHGGYLLEERQQQQQRHALQQQQQQHSTLPHQHSAPSLLEYQQTQQPLSYPVFPVQQQQGTNGGVNLYQSQYNAYPSMARGYGNQGGTGYLLSAMGHGRGYRIGPSRRDIVTDLGLLPSLSRRAQKSAEHVASEGLKEESIFADHQTSATQDVEMAEGHGDQAVKWG